MLQGGDAGGQAAISELIKEATLLSSMRHPNVVWVYGIVLKSMSKDGDSDDDELGERDQGLPHLAVVLSHTSHSAACTFACQCNHSVPEMLRNVLILYAKPA